jgi:hypothetical protein
LKRSLLSVAIALALAFAHPAAAQEQVALPNGPYVQAASGMAFPLQAGPFQRLETATRYSPDGADESVGYRWTRKAGTVHATVYVYPSLSLANAGVARGGIDAARRELCNAQFAGVEHELQTVHPTATVLENGAATITQAGAAYAGRKLVFVVSGPSAFGKDHAPLRSEAYLFCYVGGRWSVKYRFTYPAALDAQHGIEDFMRDLVWTIAPETL